LTYDTKRSKWIAKVATAKKKTAKRQRGVKKYSRAGADVPPPPPPPANPRDFALGLARSGCSDAEIAAALAESSTLTFEEAEAAVEALSRDLERSRLAGRAALRDYIFRVSMPSKPTTATLGMAGWLSRQSLGFSTGGVSKEIEDASKELDGMSNADLANYFRAKADELDGGS
jgi:hypothetical protein